MEPGEHFAWAPYFTSTGTSASPQGVHPLVAQRGHGSILMRIETCQKSLPSMHYEMGHGGALRDDFHKGLEAIIAVHIIYAQPADFFSRNFLVPSLMI